MASQNAQEEKNKIAIYSRKSKFTGRGESVENQIATCKNYVALNFPEIHEENIVIFEDEGYSGGNTNRPQFQAMQAALKTHGYKALVCYRLDRISRNIADFMKLREMLKALNVDFVSTVEQFDTRTPMGEAMLSIVMVFSELERKTTAERIRDNMLELAKTGRWLGGMTPLGYQSQEVSYTHNDDDRKRKMFKLTIIPEEAIIVKKIFALFLETQSLTAVEKYLMIHHFKTKNDLDFSRFSLKAILRNPVYLIADEEAWRFFQDREIEVFAEKELFDGRRGVMAYNKTEKFTNGNRYHVMSEWIVAVGKHKGMITGTDWCRAQALLDRNTSKAYRKPKSTVALLSGFVRCAYCNAYMRPKQTQVYTPMGQPKFTYLCETKAKTASHNCAMKNANGNELDRLVCEQICQLPEETSEFIKTLEKTKQTAIGINQKREDELELLRKNFARQEKMISNLTNALSMVSIAQEYKPVLERIQAMLQSQDAIREKMREIESDITQDDLSEIDLETAKQSLMSFSKIYESMKLEEKRDALRMLISAVIWNGKDAQLILTGAENPKMK